MIYFDFKTYNPTIQYNKTLLDETTSKLFESPVFTDWIQVDTCVSPDEIEKIKQTAKLIRSNCDVLVVIGIGGSFLGSKAIIDALSPYYNQSLEIIFLGTSLSSDYLKETLDYLKDKNFMVNVISKSGTTLEPLIAFTEIKKLLSKKYQETANSRIITTTDKVQGTLREETIKEGYKNFIVPDNIGGRYSVFTPVGLLPICAAGIDIDELLNGVKNGSKDLEYAKEYANLRHFFYQNNRLLESFTVYEPKLSFTTEWLKQLFAESQGKNKKGIFPISAVNTRDLHSLGQYYQEGKNIIFETVIKLKHANQDIKLSDFQYTLNELNNIAVTDVCQAHSDGFTPSSIIELERLDPYHIGRLFYFFEMSCAIGGFLLEINPFDQPGVNAYKNNIKESIGELN